MRDDVATRVAKGAALLDERKPGWVGLIDLSTFDLSCTDRCILGQLYRNDGPDDGFWNGLKILGLEDENLDGGADEGFDNYFDREIDLLPALQKEWVRVITILRQRREAEELIAV